MFEKSLVGADTVTGMPEVQGLRAIVARLACGVLAGALLAVPASAAAAAGPTVDLSPQLAELAKPSGLTASHIGLAEKLGLAPGEGNTVRRGNRVFAYVRFDHGATAALDELRGTGAKIVDASRRYQTITVAARPDELRDVAGVAGVAGVSPVHAPIVAGVGGAGPVASAFEPCFGAATSEGDLQLNAMAARDGFEVDGSGVKVGILSDSFNRDKAADTSASTDVNTGDLPGPGNPCGYTSPVQPLDDTALGGEDEGRAMAQIVHDLAPGASLAFATAFKSELSFAKNIVKLAEAGATVIADDVFYTEEPFFQDGPIAVAVNEVVEGGATYFSAAGNDNLVDNSGRDIASWEAPEYRDSGSCPASLVALSKEIEDEELELEGPGTGLHPDHCMDFDPGPGEDETFGITVSSGATLLADLQWAEPREGVADNIDAFLLNAKGESLTGSIESNIAVTQQPVELIEWENNTGSKAQVQLVINRYKGTEDPPLKLALLQNGGGVTATEYPESSGGDTVGPTIFGHSGAASAVGVGAVPFDDSEEPERYSSHGPVTHYFGPVTGSKTPAKPLGSPEIIAKPDVVATDGGANTFFGSCESHVWRFYGTSAAAPHAAAVAALELRGGARGDPCGSKPGPGRKRCASRRISSRCRRRWAGRRSGSDFQPSLRGVPRRGTVRTAGAGKLQRSDPARARPDAVGLVRAPDFVHDCLAAANPLPAPASQGHPHPQADRASGFPFRLRRDRRDVRLSDRRRPVPGVPRTARAAVRHRHAHRARGRPRCERQRGHPRFLPLPRQADPLTARALSLTEPSQLRRAGRSGARRRAARAAPRRCRGRAGR